MSDDENSFAARRRARRTVQDDDDDYSSSSVASRRRNQDEEEEHNSFAKESKDSSEEEEESEDESPPSRSSSTAVRAGATMGKLSESKRKNIQLQLIEGMFKYAESKYGRKRPQRGGEEKQNAMEDYELYLRSLKAKVKGASDKLAAVLKQRKDIEAKVAAAEKENNLQQGRYDKAEEEKQNATNEGRDPVLPKDFIVPQRSKRANAGLGALVMKASGKNWADNFAAMRSKKKDTSAPEWMAKQKKSDKTSALLKVGQKTKDKKGDSNTPKFQLNKTDGGSRRRRKDEEEPPNPFKVNLKKTGLRKNEEEEEEKQQHPSRVSKQEEKQSEPEPEPEEKDEEEEEEEEEETPMMRRRRNRIPASDDDGW